MGPVMETVWLKVKVRRAPVNGKSEGSKQLANEQLNVDTRWKIGSSLM